MNSRQRPVCKPILLIAEDNDMLRQSLADLCEEDYQVVEAADGKLALEQFQIHQPALILLDLNMPHLSGIDVLKTLQHEEHRCRIIVHSGHLDASTEQKCSELGAYRCLGKPASWEKLLGAMRSALEQDA